MGKQTLKSILFQAGAPGMLCAARQWVDAHAKGADALDAVNKHAASPITQLLSRHIGLEPLDDFVFLISTLPGASTTQPGLIAYYATEQKMLANIRTPVKVRRYLQKFPTRGKDAEWVERMAKDIDEMLGDKPALDVRLFSSADIDGWADAYQDNNNIRSCMSQDSIYGVSRHETYRCYATAHYGLPDNGLTLAALYHKGEYVARAIVFEHGGDKCYVRHYGDSRIVDWLGDNGYDQVDSYPNGMTLVAFPSDDGGYYHPYVDGDNYYADLCYDSRAGQHYWMLGSGGHRLDDADGVAHDDALTTCEHCSNSFNHESEGGCHTSIDGHDYYLCDNCANAHTYEVHDGNSYPETIYVPNMDDLLGTRLFKYQGEFYTHDGLYDADLAVTPNGTVAHQDNLWYCSDDEQYHTGESDDGVVDTSDIPEECGWGETHITEDYYETMGYRLAYRERDQDEFDPDGKPIVTNFDKSRHVAEQSFDSMRLTDTLVSVDTSGIHPCALFWQKVKGQWKIADGLYGDEMGLEEFITDVFDPVVKMRYPGCRILVVCDPANARDSRTKTSPTELFIEYGYDAIVAETNNTDARWQAVETLLQREGRDGVIINPDLGVLVDALDGGYQYHTSAYPR